jgi:hypothetical protein
MTPAISGTIVVSDDRLIRLIGFAKIVRALPKLRLIRSDCFGRCAQPGVDE